MNSIGLPRAPVAQVRVRVRRLTHEPAAAAGAGSSWAGPVSGWGRWERAGRAWLAYEERLAGAGADEPLDQAQQARAAALAQQQQQAQQADAPDAEPAPDAPHKKKKAVATSDLYEALGLGELRWRATEDEVKAAYKRAALVAHPDKGGSEAAFRAVQTAYETLSNAAKRRQYDSIDQAELVDTMPPPDARPPAGADPAEWFFKTFRPHFERRARFSTRQPVPVMGDASSPWPVVEAFYAFWYAYESWRDFALEDEYDPETAASRDEKRWMERQNDKRRKTLKREEMQRVIRLTDQAYAKDPRVIARLQRQAEEREAEKAARREAIRLQKEAEQREREAERARKEAEEKARKDEEERARKQREKEAKALRKLRQRWRQAAQSLLTSQPAPLSEEEVERLASRLDATRLTALCQACDSSVEAGATAARAELLGMEEAQRKKETDAKEKQAAAQPEAGKNDWRPDEVALLIKALAKYPGGATRRWEQVKTFMGTERSTKEIIAMTNQLKSTLTEQQHPHFHSEGLSKKQASPEITAAPSTNWDMPSPAPKSPSPAPKSPSPAPAAAAAVAAVAAPKSPSPAPASQPAAESKSTGVDPANWSAEEQRQLEEGLKKFPSSLGPARWDQIATCVPSRTKKQCVDRYKFIVEKLKAAKK